MLDICVVGTGYVGLVTGTCLAEIGHCVTCVDVDPFKIAELRQGRLPIYEPGLEEILASHLADRRIGFTEDLAEAVRPETLVLFIAVGTPTAEDGSVDLRAFFGAIADAAKARAASDAEGLMVLVVKSTVPVGTSKQVEAILAQYLPRSRFAVVSNPEFLREGCAVRDFLQPDRIVIGSSSAAALEMMREVYAPLTCLGHPLIETSAVETSEMIKYASNVFLATKIGLINEFSRLCEKVGADVVELAAGVGLDHRIGAACLMPGPGFGGSCFPKDLRALINLAIGEGSPMLIPHAVVASNECQKRVATTKVARALHDDVCGLRVAILGLAFKAGTDDVREAPALTVIRDLIDRGATVTAFDPAARAKCEQVLPATEYADTIEEAVTGADVAVVMTEWPEIARADWEQLRRRMQRPLLVDLRNLLDGRRMKGLGFNYVGIGRGTGEDWQKPVEVNSHEPSLEPLVGLLIETKALSRLRAGVAAS